MTLTVRTLLSATRQSSFELAEEIRQYFRIPSKQFDLYESAVLELNAALAKFELLTRRIEDSQS